MSSMALSFYEVFVHLLDTSLEGLNPILNCRIVAYERSTRRKNRLELRKMGRKVG